MNRETAVIIPSYKEVENLLILLQKLTNILPGATIVVVDDSPEAENKKIREIVAQTKNTLVISRMQKLGRGSAVLAGFVKALENKKIAYFFEMDSDMAHNPEEMKKFLEKIKKEPCDMVVGSRYLSGGTVKNMPIYRKLVSKMSNRFLSILLGVRLTDYTSGFRVYSRAAIEYLAQANIQTTGFITLSEIAYLLHRQGFCIREIPITVYGRTTGKSTVTPKLLLTSLISIIQIRLQDIIIPLQTKVKEK